MKTTTKGGALKASALLLILGCFAVSGALRFKDAIDVIDFSSAEAAPDDGGASMASTMDRDAIARGEIATASTPEDETHGEASPSGEGDGMSGHDDQNASADANAEGGAGDHGTAGENGGVEFDSSPSAPRWSHGGDEAAGEAARLLRALRQREAELNAYAARLDERQLALDAAARRIGERISDLEQAKEEFAAMVASVDQAAERDIEHLIDMYSNMKPKAAGALFDTMAPDFAAGFIGRMRADRASEIMAKMDPQKAYAVSLRLAGRNVQNQAGDPAAMQAAKAAAEAAMAGQE